MAIKMRGNFKTTVHTLKDSKKHEVSGIGIELKIGDWNVASSSDVNVKLAIKDSDSKLVKPVSLQAWDRIQ